MKDESIAPTVIHPRLCTFGIRCMTPEGIQSMRTNGFVGLGKIDTGFGKPEGRRGLGLPRPYNSFNIVSRRITWVRDFTYSPSSQGLLNPVRKLARELSRRLPSRKSRI